MGTPVTHQIRQAARQILAEEPDGVHFADLYKRIQKEHPEWVKNTVFTTVSELHRAMPDEFIKPSRGLFQLADKAKGSPNLKTAEPSSPLDSSSVLEKQFYASFASFLKSDLEDETHLEPLGGNSFRGKWNTPDIVGVYRPATKDIYKFLPEIVAGEVKIDPLQPIVAFGQAIAYRLFAHRVYIAMPNTIGEDDKIRLESLCVLFGVGLVLFDRDKTSLNTEHASEP